MLYNWQLPEWPDFTYDIAGLDEEALRFTAETGELNGLAAALTDKDRQEVMLQLMIQEAAKTSEIEGEIFSREDLMSSIKKQLGIHKDTGNIRDKKAQGVAALMVLISGNFSEKLTERALKAWHAVLMEHQPGINAGKYRSSNEPMQIISGPVGKETVHYEAPEAVRVPGEMKSFIAWYTAYKVKAGAVQDMLVKTALAHLYFESIHPFEDGNGRIGRALAEKCLWESLGYLLPVSLSAVIAKDRKLYYNELKKAQRSMNVSGWVLYFFKTMTAGVRESKKTVQWTVNKMKFLDEHRGHMNKRQLKAVMKILDAGAAGFAGGMTAKKYISINKTSRATATRDLQELAAKNIMLQSGAGRSVGYVLNIK